MKSQNKVALVTGGARRLGKDIALALAGKGFDIIISYNESSKSVLEETLSALKEKGVVVNAVKCDLTKFQEIQKLFRAVKVKYKRLDLLVNNAAIFSRTDFLETSERVFEKFIDTNLKSVFFCCQEAAKIMLKSELNHSHIINISSLGGFENWTGYIPYSLSKAGVIKLTKQLAKKLAPKIIVNSIAPGTIIIDDDENENVNPEEVAGYPMKRFARSDDITSLLLYLALENTYLTGQTIIVDGGKNL